MTIEEIQKKFNRGDKIYFMVKNYPVCDTFDFVSTNMIYTTNYVLYGEDFLVVSKTKREFLSKVFQQIRKELSRLP